MKVKKLIFAAIFETIKYSNVNSSDFTIGKYKSLILTIKIYKEVQKLRFIDAFVDKII